MQANTLKEWKKSNTMGQFSQSKIDIESGTEEVISLADQKNE